MHACMILHYLDLNSATKTSLTISNNMVGIGRCFRDSPGLRESTKKPDLISSDFTIGFNWRTPHNHTRECPDILWGTWNCITLGIVELRAHTNA